MSMLTATAAGAAAISTVTSTTSTGPALPSGDRIAAAGSGQVAAAAEKQAKRQKKARPNGATGPAPGLERVHLKKLLDVNEWNRLLLDARLKRKAIGYQALALGVGIGIHYGRLPALYAEIGTIADKVGMDKKSASDAFRELIAAGFLVLVPHGHTIKTGKRRDEKVDIWVYALDLDPAHADAVRKQARQHHVLCEGPPPKPVMARGSSPITSQVLVEDQGSGVLHSRFGSAALSEAPTCAGSGALLEAPACVGSAPLPLSELSPCFTKHGLAEDLACAGSAPLPKPPVSSHLSQECSTHIESKIRERFRDKSESFTKAPRAADESEQRLSVADAPSPAPAAPVISRSAPEVGACGASLEGKSPAGGNPNLDPFQPFQPFQPFAVPSSPVEIASSDPALPHQLVACASAPGALEVAAPGEALAAGHDLDLAGPVPPAAGAVPAGGEHAGAPRSGVTFNPDQFVDLLVQVDGQCRAGAIPDPAGAMASVAAALIKYSDAELARVLRALCDGHGYLRGADVLEALAQWPGWHPYHQAKLESVARDWREIHEHEQKQAAHREMVQKYPVAVDILHLVGRFDAPSAAC